MFAPTDDRCFLPMRFTVPSAFLAQIDLFGRSPGPPSASKAIASSSHRTLFYCVLTRSTRSVVFCADRPDQGGHGTSSRPDGDRFLLALADLSYHI